jgi:hypothetical protein
MKNKIPVNCLGWCNKSFMSVDPKTNRLCKKCSEKLKNMTNEFGKWGTKITRETTND